MAEHTGTAPADVDTWQVPTPQTAEPDVQPEPVAQSVGDQAAELLEAQLGLKLEPYQRYFLNQWFPAGKGV